MKSGLLISIILMAVAIPVLAARDPRPSRGLRRALVLVMVYNAAYVTYITLVHLKVFIPHWPG